MNGGEDQEFEAALRLGVNTRQFWNIGKLPLERVFYIYRRCHGLYHASGVDDLRDIETDVPQGKFELKPHWKIDYCNEVSRMIKKARTARPST